MAKPFVKVAVRIPKEWRGARGALPQVIREASLRAAARTLTIFRQQVRPHNATRELMNAAKSRVLRDSGVRAWYTRGIFIEGPALEYIDFVDKRRNAGAMPIEVWRENGKFRWRPFPHVANYLRIRGVPTEQWWVAIKAMARGFRGYHFLAATARIARPEVRAIFEEAVTAFKKSLTSRRRGK